MKYCINCGNRIDPDDKVCPNCKYNLPKKRNYSFILLVILVPLFCFVTFLIFKQIIIGNSKTNVVRDYVVSETDNADVKIKYKKQFHCKKCSPGCDGSCFGYEDISNCNIDKFNITNNELKYTAYYINNDGIISYISDYEEAKSYKVLKDSLKNDFNDYDLEIEYKSYINKEGLYKKITLNIEMEKYGEIDQIYTKKLHNTLSEYINKFEHITINLKLVYGKNKYLKIYPYQQGEIYEAYSDGSSIELSFDFSFDDSYEEFLRKLGEVYVW